MYTYKVYNSLIHGHLLLPRAFPQWALLILWRQDTQFLVVCSGNSTLIGISSCCTGPPRSRNSSYTSFVLSNCNASSSTTCFSVLHRQCRLIFKNLQYRSCNYHVTKCVGYSKTGTRQSFAISHIRNVIKFHRAKVVPYK